jgi:glycosyltransferase involved in cell wall biosynthesis
MEWASARLVNPGDQIGLHSRRERHKPLMNWPPSPTKLDQVGVVAIGRNEGQRLVSCLASVKTDTDNIVYVDSGSTDGSISTAEQIGAMVVKLDLAKPFTAARARNEGFAALKALGPKIRFVQFVDGDCVLARGWLEKATAFIDQTADAAIVCGRRRELLPTASIYNQLCDIEWNTPIGESLACGGDALVRVEAFASVSGFRPQLIAGEEPELCVRLRELGWKIWRMDAEMTIHDAAMTRFGQWWLRSVRCGYAYAEVSRRHRNSPAGIWRRETARALVWGGALPTIICLGALVHPAALGGVLVYILQICRIAFDQGPTSSLSWAYALFMTIAKLAEFQGILKFYWYQWFGKAATLIEYK